MSGVLIRTRPIGIATQAVSAAQYLRMSTDQQQYSLRNQESAIRIYAEKQGYTVVETYSDEAKSGLSLHRRAGLQRLLRDITSGNCSYRLILVYDVSRWGRFQDSDEAACYEFRCRRFGIAVHYCAESFSNDGSLASSLLKTLKRAMAAEFSRELGKRIYECKARLIQRGHWVGGAPAFAMRRALVSKEGTIHRVLKPKERKWVKSDHVILVPGPPEEVRCVKMMYHFALQGMDCTSIVGELNRRGILRDGKPWNWDAVKDVLTNPVYAGVYVWSRTSQKLDGPNLHLQPSQWIQKAGAFTPIVDKQVFSKVQAALRRRAAKRLRWTPERVQIKLQELLRRKGKLTARLIQATRGMPSGCIIRKRFGSMHDAYDAIGYRSPQCVALSQESYRNAMRLREELVARIQDMFAGKVMVVRKRTYERPVLCFGSTRVIVSVSKAVRTQLGQIRWNLGPAETDHGSLLCRLNAANDGFHSFYVLPRKYSSRSRRLRESDPWLLQYKELKTLSDLPRLLEDL